MTDSEILLAKPLTEITEEYWWEMLEVLPPEKWETVMGVEIFRMMEYYTGNVTHHFIRMSHNGRDRFFEGFFTIDEDYLNIAAKAQKFAEQYEKGGWHPSWLEISSPIGRGLSMIEFQTHDEEWHNFHVLLCHKDRYRRIVFGGCCNVGFIESGFIEFDYDESVDDVLQELLSDLEVYYNDGPEFTSRIVCNERM